jgi:3-oxoacyl-[acyl-carrier protein] reductase
MIILVTGGSSGLGEAITRKLANGAGNTVYFTYNHSELKAKAIETDHGNTTAIKCDFKVMADVEALKNRLKELNIDVLINNAYAGEAIKTYFHKIPAEDFLSAFTDNIIPAILLTQSAINLFRQKRSGKIITVLTSFLVNTPPVGSAVYIANKAYLEQLAKVWATENIKYNITSNSVSPSFMITGLTKDVDERIIEQMVQDHPLKKLLTIQEVAESVYFLVNATPQINGLNIIINSGTNLK